ncbi:MAG: hypothetical protein M0Q12_12775 [Synergistaceae bacterium]|jgi:hypothetical protein|nr:hypothetical protein [Synergistaceae bacterium]
MSKYYREEDFYSQSDVNEERDHKSCSPVEKFVGTSLKSGSNFLCYCTNSQPCYIREGFYEGYQEDLRAYPPLNPPIDGNYATMNKKKREKLFPIIVRGFGAFLINDLHPSTVSKHYCTRRKITDLYGEYYDLSYKLYKENNEDYQKYKNEGGNLWLIRDCIHDCLFWEDKYLMKAIPFHDKYTQIDYNWYTDTIKGFHKYLEEKLELEDKRHENVSLSIGYLTGDQTKCFYDIIQEPELAIFKRVSFLDFVAAFNGEKPGLEIAYGKQRQCISLLYKMKGVLFPNKNEGFKQFLRDLKIESAYNKKKKEAELHVSIRIKLKELGLL